MVLDLSKNNYGAETNLVDLRQTKLPIYNPDDSSHNNIQKMGHLLEWADSFILASPDYHGSMSGIMKNFLDHFWEEFAGKTVRVTLVGDNDNGGEQQQRPNPALLEALQRIEVI